MDFHKRILGVGFDDMERVGSETGVEPTYVHHRGQLPLMETSRERKWFRSKNASRSLT